MCVSPRCRPRPAGLTGSVHLLQWCRVHHLGTWALPVMTAACVESLPLYRPRDPQASDLWRGGGKAGGKAGQVRLAEGKRGTYK
jgi:hypothetical protein